MCHMSTPKWAKKTLVCLSYFLKQSMNSVTSKALAGTLNWPIQGSSLAVSSPYLRLLGLSNYWGCTPAKELVTNDCSVTFILHFSVYSRGIRLLHITYGNHKTLPTAYHSLHCTRQRHSGTRDTQRQRDRQKF